MPRPSRLIKGLEAGDDSDGDDAVARIMEESEARLDEIEAQALNAEPETAHNVADIIRLARAILDDRRDRGLSDPELDTAAALLRNLPKQILALERRASRAKQAA